MSDRLHPAPIFQDIKFHHPCFTATILVTQVTKRGDEEHQFIFTNDPYHEDSPKYIDVDGPVGMSKLINNINTYAGVQVFSENNNNALLLIRHYSMFELLKEHVANLDTRFHKYIKYGLNETDRSNIESGLCDLANKAGVTFSRNHILKSYWEYISEQLNIVESIRRARNLSLIDHVKFPDYDGASLTIGFTHQDKNTILRIVPQCDYLSQECNIPAFIVTADQEKLFFGSDKTMGLWRSPKTILQMISSHVKSIKHEIDYEKEASRCRMLRDILKLWMVLHLCFAHTVRHNEKFKKMLPYLQTHEILNILTRLSLSYYTNQYQTQSENAR